MVTLYLFTALVLLVAGERCVELVISKRNIEHSLQLGGKEHGVGHYPAMVVLHTLFLVGMLAEVWLFKRPFILELAVPMLIIAVGAQCLRWWAVQTLGTAWNTRIVVVPGRQRVTGGPYRFCQHPNYVAVVLEGFALPLIHSAWVTAVVFTVCNFVLLWVRITAENKALQLLKSE